MAVKDANEKLWDEIEAADAAIQDADEDNPNLASAKRNLNILKRRVQPGGKVAGDQHSVATLRRQAQAIADLVS